MFLTKFFLELTLQRANRHFYGKSFTHIYHFTTLIKPKPVVTGRIRMTIKLSNFPRYLLLSQFPATYFINRNMCRSADHACILTLTLFPLYSNVKLTIRQKDLTFN